MLANTFSSKRSTARAVTLYTHRFGCALIQLHSVKDELEKHLEHTCGRRLTVLRVPSVCARTEGKQPALSLAFSHSSFLHGIQMAQLVGPARRGRCGPAAARITHRRGKTMLRKSPPARASGAHRRRTSASLPLRFVATFAGEGVLLADRSAARGHHPATQEASSTRAIVMAIWLVRREKKGNREAR